MSTLPRFTERRIVDKHARDTLSAGWLEITELCHCEVAL